MIYIKNMANVSYRYYRLSASRKGGTLDPIIGALADKPSDGVSMFKGGTMKHTKGPWKVIGDGHIFDKNDKEVGYCMNAHLEPEMLANAHLIASAPNMLEVLQAGVRTLNEIPITQISGDVHDALSSLCNAMQITIRKTEGK